METQKSPNNYLFIKKYRKLLNYWISSWTTFVLLVFMTHFDITLGFGAKLRMQDSYTNPYKSSSLRFLALRIESTIQIFWKKVYESNPRYKSLRFGFANPDLRVQNFRIRKDSDLQIFIFKDSFCAIVPRICKDLLDS